MVEMESSGAIVLVKAFQNIADRDHEAAMYRRLRTLQGSSLPLMLSERCRAPLHNDRRKHALMLSWIGPPWHIDGAPMSSAELLCARAVAQRMHGLGVVHLDMWPRNLVRSGQPGVVCVVDLGMACVAGPMGAEAFKGECRRELESLDAQVLAAKAREARALATQMGVGAARIGASAAAWDGHGLAVDNGWRK
jgi:hypothetical protein